MKSEIHEISWRSLEKEGLGIKWMEKRLISSCLQKKMFHCCLLHLQRGMIISQKPKCKDQTVK